MIDRGEPTPSHEYFLELARALPKIPVDDSRVQEILAETNEEKNRALREGYFGLFGNNFYTLFRMLMLQKSGENLEDTFFHSRQVKAQRAGESFQQFLHQNAELVEDVEAQLVDSEAFDRLTKYHRDLVFARRWEDLDKLDDAVDHPLGIDAISYFYHDRLNPLLRTAAQQMQAVGVDPTEFYS